MTARRETILWALLALTAIVGAVLVWPATAAGQDASSAAGFGFTIPEQVRRGSQGEWTQLDSRPVPSGFSGYRCQVIATSTNQESVHAGNDLFVISETTTNLPDVERAPGVVTSNDPEGNPLVLGSTLTTSLRFGPDGVMSAGFEMAFNCRPPRQETTTTWPATTLPATSFTIEVTTSVSSTSPTTSLAPTTTAPESTSTSSPTTSSPTTTSSSAPPTSSPPAPTVTLPSTGAGDTSTQTGLAIAAALLATGLLLVLASRRREV